MAPDATLELERVQRTNVRLCASVIAIVLGVVGILAIVEHRNPLLTSSLTLIAIGLSITALVMHQRDRHGNRDSARWALLGSYLPVAAHHIGVNGGFADPKNALSILCGVSLGLAIFGTDKAKRVVLTGVWVAVVVACLQASGILAMLQRTADPDTALLSSVIPFIILLTALFFWA